MDIGTIIEEGERIIEVPQVRPVEEPSPVREPVKEPEKAD